MSYRLQFLSVLALIAGCNLTPSPSSKSPTGSQTESEHLSRPPSDPKVGAFKAKMAVFVEESRSLAALMLLAPAPPDFKRKLDAVTEAFTRIPDPPRDRKELADLRERARKVRLQFEISNTELALTYQLGTEKALEEQAERFKVVNKDQTRALDEIESALK